MSSFDQYDGALQMFVDAPREINLAYLRFLRWLAERDGLEHAAIGKPCGLYALADVVLAPGDGQSSMPGKLVNRQWWNHHR